MKKIKDYPSNWSDIAMKIKNKHKWVCERCGHRHEPLKGYVLTVHHLDGDKSNCADWNLFCSCQRCHLHIQSKVNMRQMFWEELMPVSKWFRPHLKGYIKSLKKT